MENNLIIIKEWLEEGWELVSYNDKFIPIYTFLYPALGLSGETGEVLEIIKKIVRDRRTVTEEDTKKIEGELGYVLFYLAQLAARFNLSLDDIAKNNLKKL